MSKTPRPYNLNANIRTALRRVWLWSPMRKEAVARAKIGRNLWQCENQECKAIVTKGGYDVDHVVQVTPETGITKPEDWGIVVKRMLYMPVDTGIVLLCKDCHKIKTGEERRASKKAKDKEAKPEKVKPIRVPRTKRVQP